MKVKVIIEGGCVLDVDLYNDEGEMIDFDLQVIDNDFPDEELFSYEE